MAKKTTKKEDKLNLESILFNCRDYLRSNATLNDNIKLSACVYPIDESSMEEFQTYIEACLTKWISSTK